jgi:hypothetical protein
MEMERAEITEQGITFLVFRVLHGAKGGQAPPDAGYVLTRIFACSDNEQGSGVGLGTHGAGTYCLAFSNRMGLISPKTVSGNIALQYLIP